MSSSKMSTLSTPKRAAYMWTDAWCDAAAKKNPLRWSRTMSVRTLVRELIKQRAVRPLRVLVEMEDGKFEREFESVESAIHWLRSKFDCHGPPSPRARGPLSACIANETSTSADCEEIVTESLDENNTPLNTSSGGDCSYVSHSSEIEATGVASHLDENQARCAKLKYMWADAGLLPTQFAKDLANANPMRWSPSMTPGEVVNDLESASSSDRPIKLQVDMPGHHEVKSFENREIAVQWICRAFNMEDDDTQETQPHVCVVCLEKEVSVMLMPCRHAVLCDECASQILEGRGSCPICRVQISNHAKGHFTTDYVDLVEAMEARMERTQAAACEGMYNNVKPLMVTGALLATGAAVCFVVAPPVAPILGAAALGVGYLPWFATTVAHFEREDMTSSTGVSPARFFSREDLNHPLTLIAKLVAMAVVAPLAAIVFFVPYGLYAGVLRPLTKRFMHGLVRVCAFAHVYAVRPTARGLQVLSEALLKLLRDIGYGAHEHALILGNILASGARCCGDALVSVGKYSYEQAAYCGRQTYEHALVPTAQAFQQGAMMAHEHVLCPMGRGCQRGASAVAHGIAAAAEVTYDYVLLPSAQVLQKALRVLGNGCVTCAVNIYSYVLLPSGRAVVLVLETIGKGITMVGRGITKCASAIYSYMLVPLSEGIAAGATMLYSNVLVPMGQGTRKGLSMLGNGIAWSAECLFRNVLAPLGRGSFTVLKALGYGTWIVLKSLGTALACTAVATYEHVLVPTSKAMALGASAVYVYVLQPCGKILYQGAAATAETVQSVARSVAHGCTVGAQGVYVYVLQPSGQAIYVAAVTSSEAASACGRGIQTASVTVVEEARHALRQSVEALHASSRGFR